QKLAVRRRRAVNFAPVRGFPGRDVERIVGGWGGAGRLRQRRRCRWSCWRSWRFWRLTLVQLRCDVRMRRSRYSLGDAERRRLLVPCHIVRGGDGAGLGERLGFLDELGDRKSTRLNSSHV